MTHHLDMPRLEAAIAAHPPGELHFRDLCPGWQTLSIGTRVRLGNRFQKAVAAGLFPALIDTGRKARGGRIYIRRPG